MHAKLSSKYVSPLDMNNLNGWAMSRYPPHGGFKWLKNIDGFDVNSISEKSPVGYRIHWSRISWSKLI